MNPNQTFEQVDESWKDTRLTCEYDPLADVVDTQFDFDYLQEPDKMTRCRCDDSESEHAFSRLPVRSGQFQCDFVYCDKCNYMMLDEDKINYNGDILCSYCAHDTELLDQYTEEQQDQLIKYAEKHSLTIEESIDYQTHCHCCGKEDKDSIFDEENHQYCNRRCFEYCEDYWYPCHKGQDCKVCEIWEYHAHRDSLTEFYLNLLKLEPVLATIDCFKELQVYGQLYECIEDLVEYFDLDRQ